ncbi:MAG: acyltransferase family protein [Salinarimonas sp.]
MTLTPSSRDKAEPHHSGKQGLVHRIEAATPKDRDRYLDFLRVVAILMVIIGHWIVRVVIEEDGALSSRYLLNIAPHWQWATLIWQVMPVFFLVGGMINQQSWQRARETGEPPASWVSRRARQLLFPVIPLIVILCVAAAVSYRFVSPEDLILDFAVAVIPLWFFAAYLMVICVTPAMQALHQRGHSLVIIGALVAATIAVDIIRFTIEGPVLGTQPAVAGVNFILVWLALHQIGFLWGDGRLPQGPSGQATLLILSVAVLVFMIGSGFYPVSMVPLETTAHPNNGSPPTAALFMLGMVQLGLALLLRKPLTRALQQPRIWAPIGLLGPNLILLLIWHQPVIVAVANVIYPLGLIPVTESVNLTWWASRPLWLLYGAVPLALMVMLMHPLARPPKEDRAAVPPAWAIALGLILLSGGITGLIFTRLHQESMPLGLPWPAIASLLAGLIALGTIHRGMCQPDRSSGRREGARKRPPG